jgi:hypothetical protein
VAGEELVELIPALVEGEDAANSIVTRDKANDQRGRRHEEFGDPCVEVERPATDVLEDVEAVTLIYVV